jgi:hypothetical protein
VEVFAVAKEISKRRDIMVRALGLVMDMADLAISQSSSEIRVHLGTQAAKEL